MQKTKRIKYPALEHPYMKRRLLINGMATIALVVGLGFLPLAIAAIIGDHNDDAWKGKNNMTVTNADLVFNNTIPAIDANQPAQLETATFGLG